VEAAKAGASAHPRSAQEAVQELVGGRVHRRRLVLRRSLRSQPRCGQPGGQGGPARSRDPPSRGHGRGGAPRRRCPPRRSVAMLPPGPSRSGCLHPEHHPRRA
jgi:hypothetical protein